MLINCQILSPMNICKDFIHHRTKYMMFLCFESLYYTMTAYLVLTIDLLFQCGQWYVQPPELIHKPGPGPCRTIYWVDSKTHGQKTVKISH